MFVLVYAARESEAHMKQDEFVTIPRLAEYYRPNTPLVGWGDTVPKPFKVKPARQK